MRARRLLVRVLTTAPGSCGGPGSAAPDLPEFQVPATPDAGSRLQALLDTVVGPARVTLAHGRYVLSPVAFTDPTCGNCEDPEESVPATRGPLLRGRGITLEGDTADPASVVLDTRSGYGVLFDGCDGCALRGVSVTGGARDPDGRATSAGVVVREGAVSVEDCVITDNLRDSAVVHGSTIAGVAGIAVREGADLSLRRSRIVRNSWDGVALYRGARATIVGNRITRYWKGIGDAVVRSGRNEAYDSGEPYCEQRPIARQAVPSGFEIEGNLVFDARQPGPGARDEQVVSREALTRAAASIAGGLDAHAATRGSAFLRWLRGADGPDPVGRPAIRQ